MCQTHRLSSCGKNGCYDGLCNDCDTNSFTYTCKDSDTVLMTDDCGGTQTKDCDSDEECSNGKCVVSCHDDAYERNNFV